MKGCEYFDEFPGGRKKKYKKKMPRRKKSMSEYNRFVQYYMNMGYSMAEAAQMWRCYKIQNNY